MKRRALVLCAALLAAPAAAHELKTVALHLSEDAAGQVRVSLKLPLARDGGPSTVLPVFDARCRALGEQRALREEDFVVREWSLACAAPLAGQRLVLHGLDPGTPDAVVVARFSNGNTGTFTLDRHDPQAVLADAGARAALSVAAYLPIGVEHILLGPDHLLFVLGLMLAIAATRWSAGRAVAALTAFTLAHSLTLALAVLGIWGLPGGAVEILIALSILLLALELAQRERRAAAGLPLSLTLGKPWLVAFLFGLLHGFGFAGALAEIGLPEQARGWALLLFNLGVELGQLLFVVCVLALLLLLRRAYRAPLPAPANGALITLLGSMAAYWTFERVLLWTSSLPTWGA